LKIFEENQMSDRDFSLPDPKSIRAEVLFDLDNYTEGPAVDAEGNLFFTDLAGKSILIWDGETLSRWASGDRPNGQALLRDGGHLVCDSNAGAVAHYDKSGAFIKHWSAGMIENLQVRCPNDIAIDQDHGFYFTDSVRHTGAVYYQGFDGKARVIAEEIDFANGIAISAKGDVLMVAESYKNRILVIELSEPGVQKGTPKVFADLPVNGKNPETGNLPDGIRFDELGRLWVAHYGMQAVQVLATNGDLLATYDTGIPFTSNLCFMGGDLIVTGGFGEPGPGRVSRLPIFKNNDSAPK